MSLFEAVVLGIVQGLTEFLPVSSTAHLRIVPDLFGWGDPGAPFTAVTQIGTLAAVLLYFKGDILVYSKAFVQSLIRREPFFNRDARLAWWMLFGTIPIALIGLVLKDAIETSFRSLELVAAVLILFSFVFLLAEKISKRAKDLAQLNGKDSMLIGIAQALALLPGVSRSGATISAGMLLNYNRETAARFSFLLSIPAVALSGLYQLYKLRHALAGELGLALIIATAVAGIVGFLSIAFLLKYLRRHTLNIFVIYRVAVGALIILLLQFHIIQP
jgi:undecaprenyl-diphosphatase